jgi:hypothetical protein
MEGLIALRIFGVAMPRWLSYRCDNLTVRLSHEFFQELSVGVDVKSEHGGRSVRVSEGLHQIGKEKKF